MGLEPTTSRLLDCRYNQLHHGTAVIANFLGKLYTHTLLCIKNTSIEK